jgi:hypothetical protein
VSPAVRDCRIEIYCKVSQGRPFLRGFFHGCKDDADLERLLAALRALL